MTVLPKIGTNNNQTKKKNRDNLFFVHSTFRNQSRETEQSWIHGYYGEFIVTKFPQTAVRQRGVEEARRDGGEAPRLDGEAAER